MVARRLLEKSTDDSAPPRLTVLDGRRPHIDATRLQQRQASDAAELVARAKAGDDAAFEAIVHHHQGQIYAYCYRLTGNAEDALDATQECFLRAYKAMAQTDGELNVLAWLYRIAGNICFDLLRRRRRIRWLPWDIHHHEPLLPRRAGDDPVASLLGREIQASVRATLNRMTPATARCCSCESTMDSPAPTWPRSWA